MADINTNVSSKLKTKIDIINVIVACQYPLLKEGISKIIQDDKKIKVISKVSNIIDLVQSCEEFAFDILLLDADLRGLNVQKLLSLVKKHRTSKVILIVENNYDENSLVNSIRSGVRGYLLKDTDSNQLIKSIKTVYDGELWVERKMMVKVIDAFSTPSKNDKSKTQIYDLTETEAKVVKQVLNGLTNKEIASHLYISEKTVKFHLYKIFKKLEVKNRSELILFGFKNGLVN